MDARERLGPESNQGFSPGSTIHSNQEGFYRPLRRRKLSPSAEPLRVSSSMHRDVQVPRSAWTRESGLDPSRTGVLTWLPLTGNQKRAQKGPFLITGGGRGIRTPVGQSPPLISSQGRLTSSGIPPAQPGIIGSNCRPGIPQDSFVFVVIQGHVGLADANAQRRMNRRWSDNEKTAIIAPQQNETTGY